MPMRLWAMLSLPLAIAPAAAQRVEPPIRPLVGQGGVRRHAVAVIVGGQLGEAAPTIDDRATAIRPVTVAQATVAQVTVGRRDQAAGTRLYPAARVDGRLSPSFGIAPYLRWSTLSDARAHTLGVADR